jgi:hypothetical protein
MSCWPLVWMIQNRTERFLCLVTRSPRRASEENDSRRIRGSRVTITVGGVVSHTPISTKDSSSTYARTDLTRLDRRYLRPEAEA